MHFDTPFLTDIAHNADPSPQDTDNNPARRRSHRRRTRTAPRRRISPTSRPAPTTTRCSTRTSSAVTAACNENIALTADPPDLPLRARPAGRRHQEHPDDLPAQRRRCSPSGRRPTVQTATATASGCSRPPGSSPRWSTSTWSSRSSPARCSRRSGRSTSTHPDINPAIHGRVRARRLPVRPLDAGRRRRPDEHRPRHRCQDRQLRPLLTAFLNPPEYFNGGTGRHARPPEQAAGSIVMGSSDQVGNELDEFVTETLRNNLLGLPLDLPTLNMTRAREAGIPPLNEVRRQIYAATNDGQLAPYTSWVDFGQHLKHPESLINFVAAYGTHPTHHRRATTAGGQAGGRPGRSSNPATADRPGDRSRPTPPTSCSAPAPGRTTPTASPPPVWTTSTCGSAASPRSPTSFGGLLGSTFNYVFQNQLENLQDGDRLYYLNRTPGMNLRTQLEGNSFAELIQRNTDGTHSLKADAFATADCKFELGQPDRHPGRVHPVRGNRRRRPDHRLRREQAARCASRTARSSTGRSTPSTRPASTASPSTTAPPASTGSTAATTTTPSGAARATTSSRATAATTSPSAATATTSSPTSAAPTSSRAVRATTPSTAVPATTSSWAATARTSSTAAPTTTRRSPVPATTSSSPVRAPDAVFGDGGDDWIQGGSGQDLLQGDHGAPFFDDPGRDRTRQRHLRRSGRRERLRRRGRRRRHGRRTRPSIATPVPAGSTGRSTSTTPSAPTTT